MEEEIYRAKDMLREIARCGRPRDCAQKSLIQEQEEKEIRRLRFVLAAGFAARHC
jgi:hypothetical protein